MERALIHQRILHVIAAAVIGLFSIQVVVILARHTNYFWDFDVYFAAASALVSGDNPYAATHPDHPFRYVYPLVSLLLFCPLQPFGPVVAPVVHFGIQLLVLLALWGHWCRRYVDRSDHVLFTIVFILAFNSCISSGLRAGNVAILEAALVWTAIAFYLRGRLLWFTALIVASACFKIVTIAFLGLLVFSKPRHKWACMIGGAAAYGLVVGLPFVAFPQWHHQMVENVTLLGDASRGALNPSLREFLGDITELTGFPNLYPLAVALIAALTAWRIFSIRDPNLRVMLFVVSLCLVLPRLKDYSYLVLILPVFWTLIRINHVVWRSTLLLVAILPTRYITRYLLGIPDEQAMQNVPFLIWEYAPLTLLLIVWTYQIAVLCKQPAVEPRQVDYVPET